MKLDNLRKFVGSFILMLLFFSVKGQEASFQEKHIEVVIRQIGHEFLLELGDSTSRVMPIKKQNGRYLLQFENEIGFEPDVLSYTAVKVLEEANMNNSFILETQQCITNEVVHSFEVSNKKDDGLLPCKGRMLPKDCYKVYITILEEVQPIVANNEIINTPKKIAKTDYKYVFIIFGVALLLGFIWFLKKKKKYSTDNLDQIQIGEYLFDKKRMKLTYKGKSEDLSNKEASLLDLLYTNVNETVNREHILNVVWDDEGDYFGRTLDVFISKLRKKLESDPKLKIINIRGIGYRIVIE